MSAFVRVHAVTCAGTSCVTLPEEACVVAKIVTVAGTIRSRFALQERALRHRSRLVQILKSAGAHRFAFRTAGAGRGTAFKILWF